MALCRGTENYRHDTTACGSAPCPLCAAYRVGLERAADYLERNMKPGDLRDFYVGAILALAAGTPQGEGR